MKTKQPSTLIGACGEHYVAGYLSALGLIVAMPRAGVPGCDLLISSSKGGRSARLQVKTGTQSTKTDKNVGPIYIWWTSPTILKRNDPDLWYAYIWLRDWPHKPNLPEVFFVPAKIVRRCVKQCVEDNEWPCFWMCSSDADKYKGHDGVKALLAAVR